MTQTIDYILSFAGKSLQFKCSDKSMQELVVFLFQDLLTPPNLYSSDHYELYLERCEKSMSLKNKGRELYQTFSIYEFAYHIVNEVIYRLIVGNYNHHAIHAGAVWKNNKCILLPGTSGKGKSTLTSWLLTQGYHYLTDELVLLENNGLVIPLVRPISLKVIPEFLETICETQKEQIVSGDRSVMIPHRLLNPHFHQVEKKVTHIIFPAFAKGSKARLTKINPSRSCFLLLQSHVNARNLPNLGVSKLSDIVKNCRSYMLTYGYTQDLHDLLGDDI